MQKVSIGFVGLSAAASSALIQSVVEQLAPEGVMMIDRDESGADITVFDEGERFLLPETKLTVEDGVATIESNFAGDLRSGVDGLFEDVQSALDAADLPDLNLRSWDKAHKAFDDFCAAVTKTMNIEAPIISGGKGAGETLVGSVSNAAAVKPRIRAGVTEEPEKDPLGEIHDRINGLVSQVATLSETVYGMSAK